jgi:alkylhydroperoxidase family enzyme
MRMHEVMDLVHDLKAVQHKHAKLTPDDRSVIALAARTLSFHADAIVAEAAALRAASGRCCQCCQVKP